MPKLIPFPSSFLPTADVNQFNPDPRNCFGALTKRASTPTITEIISLNLDEMFTKETSHLELENIDTKHKSIVGVTHGNNIFIFDRITQKITSLDNGYYNIEKIVTKVNQWEEQHQLEKSSRETILSNIRFFPKRFSEVFIYLRDRHWLFELDRNFVLALAQWVFGEGEVVEDVHPSDFPGVFTSFGKFFFCNAAGPTVLEEYEKKKFSMEGYLFRLDRCGKEVSLNRETQIKNKLETMKELYPGVLWFKTLANEWIFCTKEKVMFPFLKSKTTFTKLDIHAILGMKPKQTRSTLRAKGRVKISNEERLPHCIDLCGNQRYMGFLMEDFTMYFAVQKNKITSSVHKVDLLDCLTFHNITRVTDFTKPTTSFEQRQVVVDFENASDLTLRIFVKRTPLVTNELQTTLQKYKQVVQEMLSLNEQQLMPSVNKSTWFSDVIISAHFKKSNRPSIAEKE